MNNLEYSQRDLKCLWHPCTQMKDHESLPLVPIKSGNGVWLEDFEGKRYLDAISSWWVNLFGHSNPIINQAVKNQLDSLEHVLLAGFTHEPVIKLSEKLIELTPKGLTRCFYSDNGSSAVEVALKMSFHYWVNQGHPKKSRFVSLGNSYHGETLGALAVGDVELYKKTYAPLMMDVINVPSPDCFFCEPGESWESHSLKQFDLMEKMLARKHEEICAVIIEPLVQCAGGMRMYHPIYLQKLRAACDQYKVHLIADEIAVGFGRTGTLFACEQANISPDFICLSKGLTGGYLPLAVTLTRNRVYDAFYDDYEKLNGFLHSHSYTGNALACSAALATLDIFQNENTIEKNQDLVRHFKNRTSRFTELRHVCDVRQQGMIVAIELAKNGKKNQLFPWQDRIGLKVYLLGLEKGVLLRPLGNVVYFMPPYVITKEQIDLLTQVAFEAIYQATSESVK